MYGQSDDIARRARQFSAGAFDALLNERRERPQRPRRDDLAAGHEVDDGLARLPLSTDAKAVPIAVAERVAALARSGALSRANAALSQAKIATGPAALTALRALHPHEPPPAVPAYSRAAPDVRARQTKRALRTFRLGSSAGPSGFTADAVKSLAARCPVRALVGSPLPEDARRFLFGARLVALHKKGGGVRPIGCNDFLRRLAAKVLCASAREDLRDHLLGERQVGVCVPGGVEAPPLVLHRLVRAAPVDWTAVIQCPDKPSSPRWPPPRRRSAGTPQMRTTTLFWGRERLVSAAGAARRPAWPRFLLAGARRHAPRLTCRALRSVVPRRRCLRSAHRTGHGAVRGGEGAARGNRPRRQRGQVLSYRAAYASPH
eukprot:PhM_4_TR3026/c5_g2_i7/m.46435